MPSNLGDIFRHITWTTQYYCINKYIQHNDYVVIVQIKQHYKQSSQI
jgi:hypothetical protein